MKNIKNIDILYKCPHFLVINKPPLCYSQPPDTTKINHPYSTVLSLLANSHHDLFTPKSSPFCTPKLVHRLDYQVSGAMVLATSIQAARWFSRNLKYGGSNGSVIKKHYVALLNDTCQKTIQGTIDLKVAGKQSQTQYKLFKDSAIAIFNPLTGRKHQIRIHSAIGLKKPILGDSKYGGIQGNGLALHSAMVDITFGRSHVSIKAPFNWNPEYWTPYLENDKLLNHQFY